MVQTMAALPPSHLRRMSGPPQMGRGVALDPLIQLLASAAKKLPDTCDLGVDGARQATEIGAVTLQSKRPRGISVRDDTIPGSVPIPIRIYTPGTPGPHPLTLFFHFGGCVIGSRNICDSFCGLLADRARTVVVNVEYRLAPERPFPAAIEDALAAFRWAREHAPKLGADPKRIAVAGDSAGAMLSAVVAQEIRREDGIAPCCQLLIYPWLAPHSGLPSYTEFASAYPLTARTMVWFADRYFSRPADRQHPWASPLDATDLTGLPPALVFTAGFDPLRDEGERYATRLQEAGVPVHFHCHAHLPHAYTIMGVVPAAQQAMTEIADALGRQLYTAGA